MTLDIILLSLLFLGLIGLVVIVARKIPVLKVVDPQQFRALKEQKIKYNLIETRLRRDLAKASRYFLIIANKVIGYIQLKRQSLKSTLENKENALTIEISDLVSPLRLVTDLLKSAEQFLISNDLKSAERDYLEVLRHDQKNLTALEGLGEVYLAQRDFEQAREIYEFLNRHGDSNLAVVSGLARVAQGQGRLVEAKDYYQRSVSLSDSVAGRLALANIAQELGEPKEALTQAQAALNLEPKNPKTLDFFIELSIVNEQPITAQAAIDTLIEVNPDNNKISEFTEGIRKLLVKQKIKVKKPRARVTSFGLRRQ